MIAMDENQFGQLKSKSISSSFPKEAADFTPWLADEDTLNHYLGSILNLTFTDVRTEVPVDESRIDILARDEEDNKIIIENQYGRTDHDHLGKLITYASGVEAKYVIWIVEKSKQNHQKAVEWLNENVEDIHFFLLEAEILQIDDSKPVPKFNVVIEPNNWAKLSKSIARNNNQGSAAMYAFWSKVCEAASSNPKLKSGWRSPSSRYYMNLRCRFSGGAHLYAFWSLRDKKHMGKSMIGLGFYISNNKDLYDQLFEQKGKIEKALGYRLDWRRMGDNLASRIIIFKEETDEEAAIKWFLKRAEEFNAVFKKYSG